MEYKEINVVDRLANTLSILGDAARLSIVIYLLNQKANVGDITKHLNMSQPAISHHLRLLKDAKILKAEKKGKQVYYSLDDNHVKDIVTSGLVHMAHGE